MEADDSPSGLTGHPDGGVGCGQPAGTSAFVLPQILDLMQAQSLRDSCIALLDRGALILDGSVVERMSTPCAQVLLAAGRSAASAGAVFTIVNASDALQTALTELGLQRDFANWMV